MPPETKALSDFQNVISSEMDLQDALAAGGLDGFAVREINVRRTSFENRNLKDVLIHHVSMENTRFDNMTVDTLQWTASALRGSLMRGCDIDGMNMLNCAAIECMFDDSVIQNSSFYESQMMNAGFTRARLVRTQFQSVNMYGANFDSSFLAQVQFSDPKMGNAELSRVNFSRAMVIDSSFKNANLQTSNFSNAILVRVDLMGATLARADFRGAVLIDCKITPDAKADAMF